ncbi:MAG: sugar phosphate isomerase/epimerase [Candidatus Poribacteria bacterium]|nr:sugar phosphate isomerase/epimerase [Candidatus Poribacteria bacterium]
MKIAYAFRRCASYPYNGGALPTDTTDRQRFLKHANKIGFEGIELPAMNLSDAEAETLRSELEDAGMPCVAIRGGGGAARDPQVAAANKQRMIDAVHFAAKMGSGIVNSTVTTPPDNPEGKGTYRGESVSQGSSRQANDEDYKRTAKAVSEAAVVAADLGIEISIEIHQNSIADNSSSTLRLLELIDAQNVGINPDLGNVYWTYDIPEETCEAAITAVAPHVNYWHCKSLYRVHIPDLETAIYVQVPLPDGEIDYRFAIAAVLDAGYDGYLAIEGIRDGDQFHQDGRSVAYVKSVLEDLQ